MRLFKKSCLYDFYHSCVSGPDLLLRVPYFSKNEALIETTWLSNMNDVSEKNYDDSSAIECKNYCNDRHTCCKFDLSNYLNKTNRKIRGDKSISVREKPDYSSPDKTTDAGKNTTERK